MDKETSSLPTSRIVQSRLSHRLGLEVVALDVIPVRAGDDLSLTFEHVNSDWCQGVWLGTGGVLESRHAGRLVGHVERYGTSRGARQSDCDGRERPGLQRLGLRPRNQRSRVTQRFLRDAR